MARRQQGIGPVRTGVRGSLGAPGVAAGVKPPSARAQALQQFLGAGVGAVRAAAGFSGQVAANFAQEQAENTRQLIKLELGDAHPEFRTKKGAELGYSARAQVVARSFDASALDPNMDPGDAHAKWVEAQSTGFPEHYRKELAEATVGKVARRARQIREETAELVFSDNGSGLLSMAANPGYNFKKMLSHQGAYQKMGEALGKEKDEILKPMFTGATAALTTAASQDKEGFDAHIERAGEIADWFDEQGKPDMAGSIRSKIADTERRYATRVSGAMASGYTERLRDAPTPTAVDSVLADATAAAKGDGPVSEDDYTRIKRTADQRKKTIVGEEWGRLQNEAWFLKNRDGNVSNDKMSSLMNGARSIGVDEIKINGFLTNFAAGRRFDQQVNFVATHKGKLNQSHDIAIASLISDLGYTTASGSLSGADTRTTSILDPEGLARTIAQREWQHTPLQIARVIHDMIDSENPDDVTEGLTQMYYFLTAAGDTGIDLHHRAASRGAQARIAALAHTIKWSPDTPMAEAIQTAALRTPWAGTRSDAAHLLTSHKTPKTADSIPIDAAIWLARKQLPKKDAVKALLPGTNIQMPDHTFSATYTDDLIDMFIKHKDAGMSDVNARDSAESDAIAMLPKRFTLTAWRDAVGFKPEGVWIDKAGGPPDLNVRVKTDIMARAKNFTDDQFADLTKEFAPAWSPEHDAIILRDKETAEPFMLAGPRGAPPSVYTYKITRNAPQKKQSKTPKDIRDVMNKKPEPSTMYNLATPEQMSSAASIYDIPSLTRLEKETRAEEWLNKRGATAGD